MPDSLKLDSDQIQGNVLDGFNKDHQTFLFLQFTDPTLSRRWLAAAKDEVATSAEVAAYNTLFKKVHQRRGHASNVVQTTWMNLAFTSAGLTTLGVAEADTASFPADFRDGLAAHAVELRHTGPSSPENWRPAFRAAGNLHAVMIVAADDPDDLQDAIERFTESMGAHGVVVIDRLDGDARSDEKGHEHFGFKDGVSQPKVLGYPRAAATGTNGTGHLDPIQPGEFVLGYPTEPATQTEPPPTPPSAYGPPPAPQTPPPNTDPGPASAAGPAWTKNGSFLVIERLLQDVKAFDEQTAIQAAAAGIDPDLFRSKLVGRHKSGCPMEPIVDVPDTAGADLGLTDPRVLAGDKINNFGYADDQTGAAVPRGAHIRKANPRDGADVPGGVASVRAHRIIRRGIAFGESYRPTAPAGSPGHADSERGLIFACYQSSIQRGFEFIQQTWVNNPSFTQAGDGPDPILSEATATFGLPGAAITPFQTGGWITMTGGAYFFQPSIEALSMLSGEG